MHKYFGGYLHYYQHLRFKEHIEKVYELNDVIAKKKAELKEGQQPTQELIQLIREQTSVRDVISKLRKEMNDVQLRMHLRTTICLKDIGLFSGGNKIYGDAYSGNHVAIFETEMKAPP